MDISQNLVEMFLDLYVCVVGVYCDVGKVIFYAGTL